MLHDEPWTKLIPKLDTSHGTGSETFLKFRCGIGAVLTRKGEVPVY